MPHQRLINHGVAWSAPTGLRHEGLLYVDDAEYVAELRAFVEAGLELGEPTLVAVPGKRLKLLRGALPTAGGVHFEDMAERGRNPAWIIPFVRAFLDNHSGQRCRVVGESIWPGRAPREIAEATRHEALLNIAFALDPVTMLCPYDATALPECAVAYASCTHPTVIARGVARSSRSFLDPLAVYERVGLPLPAAPASATSLTFGRDLGEVREFVRSCAEQAGLGASGTQRLLLAAHEAVTNTLLHVHRPGSLTLWRAGDTMVCEIADDGYITDPLAGRVAPSTQTRNGRGLWLVHQLCDLVELHSSLAGTVIRLHVTAPATA